jgi:hypothetical protein
METTMTPFEIETGLKFHDDGLKSQPPEYRVHVIKSQDTGGFDAVHIASGNLRRFARTPEALANLRIIPRAPVLSANLDHLVGERVQVTLKQGSSLVGKITAVRYETVDIAGHTLRYVKELELDKSGGSSYPLRELDTVQIVSR